MYKYKVIFFGTPYIAKIVLEELYKLDIELLAVFCQPDKEINRKKNIVFSPVKEYCLSKKIEYFQPENINKVADLINDLNPDLILTCAYGQFISEKILSIPKYKCINLHASLLPKLRGGAPIHWAIINGYKKTGITTMFMTKKMDAGNIIKQYSIDILEEDTYEMLYYKLCELLKGIIRKDFFSFFNKNLDSVTQDEKLVTFGYNILKENTFIDFNNLSKNIFNLVKGLNNKPIAKILYKDKIIKIFELIISDNKSLKQPGTIVSISTSGIEISTLDFNVILIKIQMPSKNIILVKDMLNGTHIFEKNTKIN